jgi:hypothetical protein
MSSQVHKKMANPHNSLFHHGLVKLLVIYELTKQSKTWDNFLYQFSNPYITIKTSKRLVDSGVVTPPKPHSPKNPNPPTQTLSLFDKKDKKIIDSPEASSGKKIKKLVDNSPFPSTPIDSQPKKLQDAFHQYFPLVPTKRRGANRFKGESFRRSTQSMSGNPNIKPPCTLDPIQLYSNNEIPHKRLREFYTEEANPNKEVKSEHITPSLPHRNIVTPSSQMPTLSSKVDIPSTSIKEPKPSLEPSDHTPIIEKLQQENA